MNTNPSQKEQEATQHLQHVFDLLEIPSTASNKDTPRRIAKMLFREVFANRGYTPENCAPLDEVMYTEANTGQSGLIVMAHIPFSSMCEHHWVPFSGEVSVGYVPEEVIIGLSKIPRVVKFFSRKPQLQEKYTQEVGSYLLRKLNPMCLFVRVTAKHGCVMCRGAESPCDTVTSFRYANPLTKNYCNWKEEYERFLKEAR